MLLCCTPSDQYTHDLLNCIIIKQKQSKIIIDLIFVFMFLLFESVMLQLELGDMLFVIIIIIAVSVVLMFFCFFFLKCKCDASEYLFVVCIDWYLNTNETSDTDKVIDNRCYLFFSLRSLSFNCRT